MWLHPVRAVGCLAPSLLVVLLIGAGCGQTPSEKPRRQGPVGTLVGQVRLAPGAALPQYASFDLVRRPLQLKDPGLVPSECAQANEAARTAVQLTASGTLAGVVVAASDFTRVRDHRPRMHKLVIEHCRLQPAVIAATGGDILKLENRDEYAFSPLYGPTFTARPLKRGADPFEQVLIPGGVDSILCSLGAPCGRSDILVFFHPVHAVTDGEGKFRLNGFPASELVRVSAWHPLFEPSENFLWLEPGQTGTAELMLVPKARFLPPPPQAALPSQ